MSRKKTSQSGRREQLVVLVAVLIALTGLAAFIAAPREGEPVTLLPISESASRSLPEMISLPETKLIARGRIEGSYVVSGASPGFLEGLLGHGVLIVNASTPGCGAAGPLEIE